MKVTVARFMAEAMIQTDDHELTILIKGFGCGEGRWKATFQNPELTEVGAFLAAKGWIPPSDDGWMPITNLGHALVYAEPTTFAYVVRDLIRNI